MARGIYNLSMNTVHVRYPLWNSSHVNTTANELAKIFSSSGLKSSRGAAISCHDSLQSVATAQILCTPNRSFDHSVHSQSITGSGGVGIEPTLSARVVALEDEIRLLKDSIAQHRAWSILLDPRKVKPGKYDALRELLDELGLVEPTELSSCTETQVEVIAEHLKPVQAYIFIQFVCNLVVPDRAP